jgi:peptidoglycan hydrolase-like protein with peptidoglycan-binding domain
MEIIASVGSGGINKPEDVGAVQALLNACHKANLKIDKRCGPETIAAIIAFQKSFLSRPDGRIDPRGTTWGRLCNGRASPFVQLPQKSGLGYYTYSNAMRQFGTDKAIKTVADIAERFGGSLGDALLGIGDISFFDGAIMRPHHTHRDGREIDIRPLRKDKRSLPVTIFDPHYSRDLTKLLVEKLVAHRDVKGVLFNDSQIKGVKPWPGHDNHLHVHIQA